MIWNSMLVLIMYRLLLSRVYLRYAEPMITTHSWEISCVIGLMPLQPRVSNRLQLVCLWCNWQALLNPVQPVLNCVIYHHVSAVWHDSRLMSRHSNSLSTPSDIPPENPLVTWQPAVNANPSSPLLIFGDSWRQRKAVTCCNQDVTIAAVTNGASASTRVLLE